MRNYSVEELTYLEENLAQAANCVERSMEFGVFTSEEYDLKKVLDILMNCHDITRNKLNQSQVKKEIAEQVAQAKKNYVVLEDIEEIVKQAYEKSDA